MILDCAGKALDLREPRVMGVLNVTPDSFSDGGRFDDPGRAAERAQQMVAEGAAIIDIGGESTRPGAAAVSEQEELERVLPVIEALHGLDVPLSIDTSKPGVMTAAVRAGAGFINDVRALRAEGALEAAVAAGVPVCLMHMRGEPRTMQQAPEYGDVLAEVSRFLVDRAAKCMAAGIPAARIVLDPGFGFGKTLDHNIALLRGLGHLAEAGFPLLVGVSRKSMIGNMLDAPVERRVQGSVAAAAVAVYLGASIVRAHDVRETVDAVRVAGRLRGAMAD